MSVTKHGLCRECNAIGEYTVKECNRIVAESIGIVNKSKKIDTILFRFQTVHQMIEEMHEWEKNDYLPFTRRPSELLADLVSITDSVVSDHLSSEVQAAFEKSSIASTPRTKITPLQSALAQVRKCKPHLHDSGHLEALDNSLRDEIHQIQLAGFLETAKKLEFKGQKKKALDQYLEALYFLRNDDVDDRIQKGSISAIERKVTELGGDVPPGSTHFT